MSVNVPEGPAWAAAFGLLLVAFRGVIERIIEHAFKKTAPAGADVEKGGSASVIELARSVERLAAEMQRSSEKLVSVVERMERFQERTLDTVLENQRRIMDVLGRIMEVITRVDDRVERIEGLSATGRLIRQVSLVSGKRKGD